MRAVMADSPMWQEFQRLCLQARVGSGPHTDSVTVLLPDQGGARLRLLRVYFDHYRGWVEYHRARSARESSALALEDYVAWLAEERPEW